MVVVGSSGRRRRRWALVPPLLILAVSLGLLVYRMNVSDWYWGSVPKRTPVPTLARVDHPGPVPFPTAPIIPPDDPKSAEPEARTEALEGAPPDAAVQVDEPSSLEDADDSIRREAEQARAHRDEIARLKERETERLDRIPTRPDPGFGGLNPAQLDALRRHQLAVRRQMEAMMEAQVRRFEGMFRDQAVPGGRRRLPAQPPLPWGGLGQAERDLPAPGFLPGLPAEVQAEMDRMFDEVFRMQPRPGLRRPPADRIPPPIPRQPPGPPSNPPPADETYSRSFT